MKHVTIMKCLVLGALLLALNVSYSCLDNTESHTTCCAINVEYLGDDTAVIYYEDAVTPEFSYNIFVEVEYPEEGMLDWDVMRELVDETVERMQGDCKRNHQ